MRDVAIGLLVVYDLHYDVKSIWLCEGEYIYKTSREGDTKVSIDSSIRVYGPCPLADTQPDTKVDT